MDTERLRFSRRDLLRTSLCSLGGIGAGCLDTQTTDETSTTATETARCETRDYSNMELVFEDTFDSDTIDTEKWRTNYPWGSREHNYDGYASSQNVYLYDGKLVIEAEDRPRNGKSYTTGVAAAKRPFSPGYVEGYIKTPPAVSGFWPAFWLTSVSEWPPEIDLFEFFGSDPRAWMSYHYRDTNGDHQRITSRFGGSDFSNRFHKYAVDWNADRIIWYIDGVERFRYGGEFLEIDDMWLIFNFGIDPEFLDSPSSDDLPATLEMASVRVWERTDSVTDTPTSTESGTNATGSNQSD